MKALLSFFLVLVAMGVRAQNKVQWKYTVTQKEHKYYEVRITASLEKGWHIYSVHTPEGGPFPTKITYNKNPLAYPQGGIKEIGRLEKRYEDVFDIDTKYYQDSVAFVQLFKLKASARTALTGKVEFMLCNEQQCMPPTEKSFTVILN